MDLVGLHALHLIWTDFREDKHESIVFKDALFKHIYQLYFKGCPGGGSGRPFSFAIQEFWLGFGPDPGGNLILVFIVTLSTAGINPAPLCCPYSVLRGPRRAPGDPERIPFDK